jgi:hypothetical protein
MNGSTPKSLGVDGGELPGCLARGDAYVDGELDAESASVQSVPSGIAEREGWAGSTTQRRIIRPQIVCARLWRGRPKPVGHFRAQVATEVLVLSRSHERWVVRRSLATRRNRSRARDSVDMTVPIGMPITSAISL